MKEPEMRRADNKKIDPLGTREVTERAGMKNIGNLPNERGRRFPEEHAIQGIPGDRRWQEDFFDKGLFRARETA